MESKSFVTFVLLALAAIAAADRSTPSGHLKSNCFSDESHGTCEESRVKICGDYYACNYIMEFDAPPKRIASVDGEILVAVGSKTFVINNYTQLPEHIVKVIPPWGELEDKKGNKYYAGDGTSYVTQYKTGKEIEIVTTGEYSFNQHALDTEANKLFILTFTTDSASKQRSGALFAATTDPLDIEHDDKVHAERVEEAGNQITALAVQGNLDTLLLGTTSKHGGKMIRMVRMKYDPCSLTDSNKAAINEIIEETQHKLIHIFDSTVKITTRNSLAQENLYESQKTLSLENARLKRELETKTSTINSFTTELCTIKDNLKELQSSKDAQNTVHKFEELSIAQAQAATEDPKDPHVCVPASQVKALNSHVDHLQTSEHDLTTKIYKIAGELEGIINELKSDKKSGVETRFLGDQHDDRIRFVRK